MEGRLDFTTCYHQPNRVIRDWSPELKHLKQEIFQQWGEGSTQLLSKVRDVLSQHYDPAKKPHLRFRAFPNHLLWRLSEAGLLEQPVTTMTSRLRATYSKLCRMKDIDGAPAPGSQVWRQRLGLSSAKDSLVVQYAVQQLQMRPGASDFAEVQRQQFQLLLDDWFESLVGGDELPLAEHSCRLFQLIQTAGSLEIAQDLSSLWLTKAETAWPQLPKQTQATVQMFEQLEIIAELNLVPGQLGKIGQLKCMLVDRLREEIFRDRYHPSPTEVGQMVKLCLNLAESVGRLHQNWVQEIFVPMLHRPKHPVTHLIDGIKQGLRQHLAPAQKGFLLTQIIHALQTFGKKPLANDLMGFWLELCGELGPDCIYSDFLIQEQLLETWDPLAFWQRLPQSLWQSWLERDSGDPRYRQRLIDASPMLAPLQIAQALLVDAQQLHASRSNARKASVVDAGRAYVPLKSSEIRLLLDAMSQSSKSLDSVELKAVMGQILAVRLGAENIDATAVDYDPFTVMEAVYQLFPELIAAQSGRLKQLIEEPGTRARLGIYRWIRLLSWGVRSGGRARAAAEGATVQAFQQLESFDVVKFFAEHQDLDPVWRSGLADILAARGDSADESAQSRRTWKRLATDYRSGIGRK